MNTTDLQMQTTNSIINVPDMTALNCWPQTYGCCPTQYWFPYCPTPSDRQITIEAVDGGGFLVTGHFPAKGIQRRVATNLEGVALILGEWKAGQHK